MGLPHCSNIISLRVIPAAFTYPYGSGDAKRQLMQKNSFLKAQKGLRHFVFLPLFARSIHWQAIKHSKQTQPLPVKQIGEIIMNGGWKSLMQL